MDDLTPAQRHKNMSHIRAQNTKIEVRVRQYLFAQGFRFRKNDKRYPGHPDVVLPKYNTVIFVNGCFWHHHEGCRYATIPKTNVEYWKAKLRRNVENDKRHKAGLENDGWQVITIWECQLKKDQFDATMQEVVKKICNDKERK